MPSKTLLFISLLFLVVFFANSSPVSAQGVIVPGPCQRCPQPERPVPVTLPRTLPIKSIKIDTKIVSQVATTHLEQVFRNDSGATLEGTYLFPIPEAASIVEFAIWDGERRLVGEVRSREEARKIYDEIVRRQRDPGLLEYAGKDLFQASIFPIAPHSDKKLELTYSQVLRAEAGTVSYRYPLGMGRQLTTIGSVAGRVVLESKEPVRNIYSPSHAISVTRSGERNLAISFESVSGQEPEDFRLFYTLSNQDFGVSLLTHREAGKDGYFLLMISPKDDWREQEYAAKDIVFVLDTSGSMAEEGKMEKARAALLYGIRILRPKDRFNVISFAGEERLFETGLIAADDEGRKRGETFVQGLRPVGGTNINEAVLAALRQFRVSDRPKMIVFMTDGLPTAGETNPTRILDNAIQSRIPGLRLFSFGVGYNVNTALLDKLAADNGGVADYVEPKEDLEAKVSTFFARVNSPVLTDLRLDLAGVETDLVYPRALPDVFRGSQVTLIGRYRNDVDMEYVRLQLSGKSGGSSKEYLYNNQRFPLREDGNDFLPRLWATRRVGWLMEQIRTNGEAAELRDEVVDLGTRYGIVTPYTSFLALESGATIDDVMRVSGAAGRGRALGNAAPPSPASAAQARVMTGTLGVRESKRARSQQDAERFDKDSLSAAVRTVGGKTFYLREGVWTDAEFKADAKLPETPLKFGSDEYFALLTKKPRLGGFFALGEKVIVVFEGRVYRVTGQ
ncbi:MAG TPA: VIT and VWA domain-containing protein [Pyrinomonadaceae bacterium]|nr:VIT and VWA domain-containing protein [Pyrinomonadaceae bacterium]